MHYEQLFVDRRMCQVNEFLETIDEFRMSEFGTENGVLFFRHSRRGHRLPLKLSHLWGNKFSAGDEAKVLVLALGDYITSGQPVAPELLRGAELADYVQSAISAGIAVSGG